MHFFWYLWVSCTYCRWLTWICKSFRQPLSTFFSAVRVAADNVRVWKRHWLGEKQWKSCCFFFLPNQSYFCEVITMSQKHGWNNSKSWSNVVDIESLIKNLSHQELELNVCHCLIYVKSGYSHSKTETYKTTARFTLSRIPVHNHSCLYQFHNIIFPWYGGQELPTRNLWV